MTTIEEIDLQIELLLKLIKRRKVSDCVYPCVEMDVGKKIEYSRAVKKMFEKVINQYKKAYMLCDELSTFIELKKWEIEKEKEPHRWIDNYMKELGERHQSLLENDTEYKAKWEQYQKEKDEIESLLKN